MDSEKRIPKTENEWREKLTPEQYRILRNKGTERAFGGEYWDSKEEGKYLCAGCGSMLFDSKDKFDSGTGWPSFHSPASQDNVLFDSDNNFGMERREVRCAKCGGHLGHVFNDGPKPTEKRYCINSVALDFSPEKRLQT